MDLQEVERKARFGHKDWLHWCDRQGQFHSEWKTPKSMKQCLLDCGTQGWWCLVMANSGCPMKGFWAMGINLLAQMKRGWQ